MTITKTANRSVSRVAPMNLEPLPKPTPEYMSLAESRQIERDIRLTAILCLIAGALGVASVAVLSVSVWVGGQIR